MGWKDRDYSSDTAPREFLRPELIVSVASRGAASVLVVPLVVALGELAFALGWVPGDTAFQVDVAAALAGLACAVVASTVAIVEHYLGTVAVKQLDHCALAGAITLVSSAVLLRLALSQIVYALASARFGPLVGLEASVSAQSPQAVSWLYDASALCSLAAPFAALAAVRGDEDDRPLRQELALVAGIATAVGALTGITIALLHPFGPSSAPSVPARLFLLLIVPPLVGSVLSVAARLGTRLEGRAHGWLVPEAP